MRGAHQGVPVADLPGAPSGFMGGLFAGNMPNAAHDERHGAAPAGAGAADGEQCAAFAPRRARHLAAQQFVRRR